MTFLGPTPFHAATGRGRGTKPASVEVLGAVRAKDFWVTSLYHCWELITVLTKWKEFRMAVETMPHNKTIPEIQNPPTFKQGTTDLGLSIQMTVTLVPQPFNTQLWHNRLKILLKSLLQTKKRACETSLDAHKSYANCWQIGGNVLKEIDNLIHIITKKKMTLFLHAGNRCSIINISFSSAEDKFIELVARNWSYTSSPLRKTSST